MYFWFWPSEKNINILPILQLLSDLCQTQEMMGWSNVEPLSVENPVADSKTGDVALQPFLILSEITADSRGEEENRFVDVYSCHL